MPKKRKASDLVDALHDRYYDTLGAQAELDEARGSADVSRQIYALRTEAGLSQRELAKLVGTQHTVICRLEDDDYEGHSMKMLRRIARAVGKRVEIRFIRDPEARRA